MQNFDEIKRMADMARTMRERGLARDSIDAMNQARSATSSDPAILQARKEELLQERINILERKFDMAQRRIEELQASLEGANKRLADTVTLLTNMNTKLRDIETQQANAQLASIPPIHEPAWQQPQQWGAPHDAPTHNQWNQACPPQIQAQVRAPEPKPIDRNGVAPADISVEKFFYFGNKR